MAWRYGITVKLPDKQSFMPTSHRFQLNEIVDLMMQCQPDSVLDIGVGFGKYGFLAREYLELWGENAGDYGQWKKRVDGIEIFETYLRPFHRELYDHIHIGNALDILPGLDQNYDLILLVDVLEHFDYEDGKKLLSLCFQKGKNVLISTPLDIGTQGEAHGNIYETHHFQWEQRHLKSWGPLLVIPNHQSLICLLGEMAPKIGEGWRKRQFKFWLKRNFPRLNALRRKLR